MMRAISYTKRVPVRTNIEIDDVLMADAMRESRLPTKKAVVEAGLRALIERTRRKKLLEAFGKYPWEGDLQEMRDWYGDDKP
jgi:Arc/MetJ family transcription regulator